MTRTNSARLDRKKLLADPLVVLTIIAIILFLTLFIIYPLFSLLIESVYNEGRVTLAEFRRILTLPSLRGVMTNTLKLGLISGTLSTAIGFLFAYVDCYLDIPIKFVRRMFNVVALLPIVSPPFVIALSCILLFGRSGLITRNILGIYDFNIAGLHGIVIVQTLTFFPICYLMLRGLLKNIDPSIEESARNMGASRFRVFTTVTFPLMLPGLGNAFLVVFIEAISDFTNPILIGGSYSVAATAIFLQIMGAYDTRGAAALAVVLLGITIVMFSIQKYWIERKTVSTLSGKASRERQLIKDKSVVYPLSAICGILSAFVLLMYALVPLGALFRLWGRDYSLTLDHFRHVYRVGARVFEDSVVLSLIAAPITAIAAMLIAYLIVKRTFWGKKYMEFVSLFAMAVPGTVLGIGFIRGFNRGLFDTEFLAITGTGTIIVIAFIVRSLPVGIRSGVAALRQIDKSIEESAYDLGAGSGRVFMSVTLPLIKDSFFSGLVTAFVRSMTATSAVILLVSPSFQLITPQIMAQADIGRFGVACAYATILIIIVYGAILLMNLFLKFFGTSRKVKEVNYT